MNWLGKLDYKLVVWLYGLDVISLEEVSIFGGEFEICYGICYISANMVFG